MRRSWHPPLAAPHVVSRPIRTMTLAALLAAAMVPAAASAQEDEITFPFTTSGEWAGLLDFSGSFSSDYVGDDGFRVNISDVIGSTSMPIDLNVSPDGTVDGTMVVYLEWFSEGAGESPLGDPYHVQTDHIQKGALVISGTAARLVVEGELDYETITAADGGIIEEVSGTERTSVEWVFSLSEATCSLVTGSLTEASGVSLLRSSFFPPVLIDSGTEYHNELKVQLVVWPKSEATSQAVDAAVDEVTALADEVKSRKLPQASHLMELVDAWVDMQAEVAALNECPSAGGFVAPPYDRAWLVTFLQGVLGTALESPDVYEASELIDLWDVGKFEHVLDGELVIAFLDALHAKLDAAIAEGDAQTIDDIAAFASANQYPSLAAKASAAST